MKKYWPEIKNLLLVLAFWRSVLFIFGFLSARILPFKNSFPYIDEQLVSSNLPQWIWSWGNFDGVHYLDIAKNGYHAAGLHSFFPLYPALIKVLSMVVGNYLFSGLLISNVSFFIATIMFFFLVKKNFNQQIAKWSIVFLLTFPTSYYFGSIYTESLFLVLILGVYFFEGSKSLVFSILSGTTRLAGSFVGFSRLLERKKLFYFLSILGLLCYMAYLNFQFHDPLKFLSGQQVFGNSRASSLSSLVLPPQVIYRYFKIFMTVSPSHYDFWVALSEISFFVFAFVVLLIASIKKMIPKPWLIYSWLSLFLPVFSGTLSSMPRYVVTLFPIYIVLASIGNKVYRYIIVLLFAVLSAIFIVLFNRGYWIA